MRADGQVMLHVRDALASKLPPGVLVSIPATLVRPQRKHVHQWADTGEWMEEWRIGAAGQRGREAETCLLACLPICVHACRPALSRRQSPADPADRGFVQQLCCPAFPVAVQGSRPSLDAMARCGWAVQTAAAAASRRARCRRQRRWRRRCERWQRRAKWCRQRQWSMH